MPAIYMSFAFEPDDTVEQRMSKLYLGIISTGEQLYTYNAAITELRKGIAKFDTDLARMRAQYEELKLQVRGTNSTTQLAAASSSSSDTEILPCGCRVMKGWRCPVHSAP